MSSTTTAYHVPPIPTDPHDQARWEHTRLRRRMITGQWRRDLQDRVIEAVGHVRAEAWGVGATRQGGVDLSSNVLSQVAGQLACLYDRPPRIGHDGDPVAGAYIEGLLTEVGWDSFMQRVQRDTLALREMLIRVEVIPDEDGQPHVLLRPVPPDMVVAAASSEDPEQPTMIREARLRARPDTGEQVWLWDELDIRDAANPTYRILSDNGKEDWTEAIAGASMSGPAYPYRDSRGRPVLPYVLIHASRTGSLWDAWHGVELVEGALQAGVHLSMYAHAMTTASWPQRVAVGVELPGDYQDEDGDGQGRHQVVADPSAVLLLHAAHEGGQPMLHQWGPGADIGAMSEAVERYERRVASFAGISASDLLRVSGDPRSGYALMISREGKREASKQFEAVFRVADRQLARLVAIMINQATGSSLPEGGYEIVYQALPLSAEERKAILDEVTTLLDKGLIDEDEAKARLTDAGIIRRPEVTDAD